MDLRPADVVHEDVDATVTLFGCLDDPTGLAEARAGRGDMELAGAAAAAARADDPCAFGCEQARGPSPMPPLEPVTRATFPSSPSSTGGYALATTMTTLFVARHGQTDWNLEHRWQGWADPPLNATGRAQAAELGEAMTGRGIAAVVSSDLRRAAETAEIAAARLGLPVELDSRLREVDVGEWSGLTSSEVEARYPAGYRRRREGDTGWVEGETLGAMAGRVVAALLEFADRQPEDGARGGTRRPLAGGADGVRNRRAGAAERAERRRRGDHGPGRSDAMDTLDSWRITRTSTRVSRSRWRSSAASTRMGC
jgi:probable phosphoglycerate mutase